MRATRIFTSATRFGVNPARASHRVNSLEAPAILALNRFKSIAFNKEAIRWCSTPREGPKAVPSTFAETDKKTTKPSPVLASAEIAENVLKNQLEAEKAGSNPDPSKPSAQTSLPTSSPQGAANAMTSDVAKPEKKPGKIKAFFKKYGWLGVGVYSGIYFGGMPLFYVLINYNLLPIDPHNFLSLVQMIGADQLFSISEEAILGPGGKVAMALTLNELLEVVRIPLAIWLTVRLRAFLDQRKINAQPEKVPTRETSESVPMVKTESKASGEVSPVKSEEKVKKAE